MALGNNIRTLRNLRKWTLAKLSAATHKKVGSSTIGELERRDSASSAYATELADALEVSLDKLINATPEELTAEFLNPAQYVNAPATSHSVSESVPTTDRQAITLVAPSSIRSIVDALGEAMDTCSQESRNAVSSLLQQYALNPRPGPVADAIVMFLERCVNPNADNPYAKAPPVPSTDTNPTGATQ